MRNKNQYWYRKTLMKHKNIPLQQNYTAHSRLTINIQLGLQNVSVLIVAWQNQHSWKGRLDEQKQSSDSNNTVPVVVVVMPSVL